MPRGSGRECAARDALVALSPVPLGVERMAWTEPPFVLATLGLLLVLQRIWRSRAVTPLDLAAGVTFLITNSEMSSYHLWTVAQPELTRALPAAIAQIDGWATTVACTPGAALIAWFGAAGPDLVAEYGTAGALDLTVLGTHPDGALLRAEARQAQAACP